MGAPPTTHQYYQPPSVHVVCRCCLSEEVEMTDDYLPLDAATSKTFSFCTDDAAAGDSSSASTATLLDCLNGCARIGATLEDSELPLHICLDCCQALEACCEFIRCVQNADKILRRKRFLPPSTSVSGTASMTVGDVAEKAVDLKAHSLLVEGLAEEQLLPIGSLNLQDVIIDSQMEILDLSSSNKSPNASSTSSDSSTQRRLTTAAKEVNQSLYNLSSQLPSISSNDFGYQSSSKLLQIVEAPDYISDEISGILKADISTNSKDCGSGPTPSDGQTNAIPDTHKFIPPLVKDTNKCKESSLDSQTILTEAPHELNQSNCADILIVVQRSDISTKYASLLYHGRKYIVDAAIAHDLKAFHEQNLSRSKHLCRFCIFECDRQSEMDEHVVSHLGPPCYSCSLCSFKCRFKYYLMKHLKRVHNAAVDCAAEKKLQPEQSNDKESATKFFCGICHCFFSSFIALQQHHHIDEDSRYQCKHCDVQETSREQLMEHMAKDHKTFIDAPLIATYLSNANKTGSTRTESNATTYLNRTFLSQFIKFHAKEQKGTAHLCQFCSRSFKKRFHLLKHIHYMHSKDKKKENENCFKRRPNKLDRQKYTRHLQAEHKLKCDVCGRVFKTYAELSAHAQQHKSTQFECLTCRTVFSFEFELKYHMRTHTGSSSSSSPRSEYHVAEPGWSLNASLRSRLQKLNPQKQNRKLASLSSTKRKPTPKRRLSLASVSTAKSSEEGSPNSPGNANSDEDMPPASTKTSESQGFQDDEGGNAIAAISVADVMLPQGFQNTSIHRLNTQASLTASDFATPSLSSSFFNDKLFNCDSSDQTYLNDFDLNLLDCSDDFWLQLF